jgi:DeoR/GlpR family transcriptional regulator of sugar metabolism
MATPRDLLSVREAAAVCHRNEETVRRWVWSGKLSAQKIGNQLFVRQSDLTRLARQAGRRRVGQPPPVPEAKPSHFDQGFAVRETLNLPQKIRIAQAAVALVADGASIALDAGTTTLQIARLLGGFTNLTVVTNSLDAAAALCDHAGITVLMPGGILRSVTRSLVGPQASDWFESHFVDIAFLGTTGVTADQGVANSNPFEIEVQKAIVQRARRVVVVADESKIGRNGFLRSLTLDQVHDIITNDTADAGVVAQLRRRVNVILA